MPPTWDCRRLSIIDYRAGGRSSIFNFRRFGGKDSPRSYAVRAEMCEHVSCRNAQLETQDQASETQDQASETQDWVWNSSCGRGARHAGMELVTWAWNSSRGRGTRHLGVELVTWAWNSSRGRGTRHAGVELVTWAWNSVLRRKVEFGVQKSRLIVPGI